MKILLTLVLPGVVVSCSFKKDPESKRPKIVMIQQQSVPEAPARTLEAIIAEDTDEEIIESLVGFKAQIEQMRSGPVSVLDLAIKYKKYDLLAYLIVIGESPFNLNEQSYRLMGYDGDVSRIISSAQKDQFIDVVRAYPRPKTTHYYHYPEAPSLDLFYSRVSKMPLGAAGCEAFVDFVLDFAYGNQKNVLPGVYQEAINDVDGRSLVSDLLYDPSCRAFASKFGTANVSKWLTKEILWQFQHNFADIDFIRLIVSLNASAQFDFTVPKSPGQSVAASFINRVSVDPAFLVLLKAPCMADDNRLKEWLTITSLIKAKRLDSGHFSFISKPATNTPCVGFFKCDLGTYNDSELNTVAAFFYPHIYGKTISSELSFSNDLFKFRHKIMLMERYKDFSMVCNSDFAEVAR